MRISGLGTVIRRTLCAIAACAVAGGPVHAQSDAPPDDTGSGATGEVQVSLVQFGLGGAARPGEWTPLRINLLNLTDKPRDVLLRVDGFDPDGDTPRYERRLSTTPGIDQQAWLYVRLPYRFDQRTVMTASAYASDPASGAVGELLGRTRFQPARVVDPISGLMAIVGRRTMGLEDYGRPNNPNEISLPEGHELTHLAIVDDVRLLPDRWMGLSSFEALVWSDADPSQVSADRVGAIGEWVRRGGHLIVVLPAVGQAWLTPGQTELAELLPDVTVTRVEDTPLEPLRSLLTHEPESDLPLPESAVVNVLTPNAAAEPEQAQRILEGEGGRCVVARRLMGAGAVTLVGLDLTDPRILRLGVPETDVFWHRVLGRRGHILTPAEIQNQKTQTVIRRDPKLLDVDVRGMINKSGQATKGIFLAFIIFAVYWAVAGPGGYAALKQFKKKQHAWLAFFLASVIFTALAWGGATSLKPAHVEVMHLTYLDHVYGQPNERARTWASLLIPSYGSATIEVGAPDPSEERGTWRQAIAPWDPPSTSTTVGTFPDTRAYPIESRYPDTLTVPTRSTVKQVQIDWAGPPELEMPLPVSSSASASGGAIALKDGVGVEGVLQHNLPAPLRDVVVIVVKQQRPLSTDTDAGQMMCQAFAWSGGALSQWSPGDVLDLGVVCSIEDASGNRQPVLIEGYLDTLFKGASQGLVPDIDALPTPGNVEKRLKAISLYEMLDPPDKREASGRSQSLALRQSTHTLGLGRWFTQPCVIIIGHLGRAAPGAELTDVPYPLYVDGQRVSTQRGYDVRGHTVVRWIYPLPSDPPEQGARAADTQGPTAEPNAGGA